MDDFVNNFNARYDHIKNYSAALQSDGTWLHDDGDVFRYDHLGRVHCEFGPAILHHIEGDGWYLDGIEYGTFEEWLIDTAVDEETKMMLRLQYA